MPFPSQPVSSTPPAGRPRTFQFTRTGLIIFCVALVSTTALFTGKSTNLPDVAATAAAAQAAPARVGASGPWGELVTEDIFIEQPEEYVSLEKDAAHVARWVFPDRKPADVRTLMNAAGMSDAQITAALDPARVEVTDHATLVSPADAVVLGLGAEVRAVFYAALAEWPANEHMAQPYHLDENHLEARLLAGRVAPATIALIRKLIYRRQGNAYFSDVELVARTLPDTPSKVRLLKVLSGQTAVLAGLRLYPDSDIDKLAGYWGKTQGVRTTDIRPLLESVARAPTGGTLNVLHLLPPFARERLFTFPLPPQAGEAKQDCHWSALNFFSTDPDPRMSDIAFASAHVQANYFEIGAPSMIGDIVFLLDPAGGVIHSAVYIADDIVFTKNGINFGQPWILMRLPDLVRVYTLDKAPKVQCYRRKDA